MAAQFLSYLLIAGRRDGVEKVLLLQKGKEEPVEVSCHFALENNGGVPVAPCGARAEMAGREQPCFVNTNPALGY